MKIFQLRVIPVVLALAILPIPPANARHFYLPIQCELSPDP